jgi:hypothetical protein
MFKSALNSMELIIKMRKVVMIRLRVYLLRVVGKMHDIVVRTLMDVRCNT